MKTLMIIIAAFVLLMNATVSGKEGTPKPANDKIYCAEMKDSVLVVMREGQPLTQDIIFENGTEVKTDGKVVFPDGVTATLKAGECIDQNGIIKTPVKASPIHN